MAPVAKKKPSGMKAGDEATDVVLKYLKKQNRPYSAVDIFNNLGGAVNKVAVTKTLSQLVEEQQIHGKQYGKQWVYVAKQDEYEQPSKDALDEMDARIAHLKEQVATTKEENRQLQSTLNGLTGSLTNEQIEARLVELDEENAKLDIRLEKLRSGGASLLSKEDFRKIDTKLDDMRKEWRKRKRMFNEAWGAVTENVQGNLSEFAETVGVETDEMAGVDIKNILAL
ncbi:hypothetical protein HDU85_000415 [Gaertneriomyces sp. JEL0708]|nr:hypothetical protein HDU85_000415 [Gaertneriomyces sp. JEL0708]